MANCCSNWTGTPDWVVYDTARNSVVVRGAMHRTMTATSRSVLGASGGSDSGSWGWWRPGASGSGVYSSSVSL